MRSFFDTNVLVYLFDTDEPVKKAIAENLFERETSTGQAVFSTQVLQEFYVVVTRKLKSPLPPDTAEKVVCNLAALPVIQIGTPLIIEAISRNRKQAISFWDALIISAALEGKATRLLTEDLQHGQVIDGLRIENPFADLDDGR